MLKAQLLIVLHGKSKGSLYQGLELIIAFHCTKGDLPVSCAGDTLLSPVWDSCLVLVWSHGGLLEDSSRLMLVSS